MLLAVSHANLMPCKAKMAVPCIDCISQIESEIFSVTVDSFEEVTHFCVTLLLFFAIILSGSSFFEWKCSA